MNTWKDWFVLCAVILFALFIPFLAIYITLLTIPDKFFAAIGITITMYIWLFFVTCTGNHGWGA